MLWLKRRLGEAVIVDGERLVFKAKRNTAVDVAFNGVTYRIPFGSYHQFPKFTLHVAKGLRFGFETDANVVREELL